MKHHLTNISSVAVASQQSLAFRDSQIYEVQPIWQKVSLNKVVCISGKHLTHDRSVHQQIMHHFGNAVVTVFLKVLLFEYC